MTAPSPLPTPLRDRIRSRIPSWRHFCRRVMQDRRNFAYDLVVPVASTPARRDRIADWLSWLKPKTAGFSPSAHACRMAQTLKRDGLSLDLPPLDPASVTTLRRHFETVPCHDPYRPHLGCFAYDSPASPETNMGYFTAAETLAAPGLLALLNDPEVLAVAEIHLGCKPLLDNVIAWWAFGGRDVAKGTQRFHRDFDSLRGFKLFLYLTDVDEGCGPHVFIRGSHDSPLLDTGKAQEDATIRDVFGAENEVVITGAAGTRFIADTFGYHKGALPVSGRRLMVAAQYNINASPHAPRQPVLKACPPGFDRAVNRLYTG
jgi:hypothetical protein